MLGAPSARKEPCWLKTDVARNGANHRVPRPSCGGAGWLVSSIRARRLLRFGMRMRFRGNAFWVRARCRPISRVRLPGPHDERRDNKRLLDEAARYYLFFSVPRSSIKSAKRSHDSS